MNILKMDKDGYEKYLEELKEIEKKLNEVRRYKGEVAIHQGDNWHDNPTLYSTESQERGLMRQLCDMKEQLKYIQIVEKSNDEMIVDIGDVINIALSTENEQPEEMFIKLVGHKGNFSSEINEISVNSPLGIAVYKKNVGENVSYKVNDNQFNVAILEKINMQLNDNIQKVK